MSDGWQPVVAVAAERDWLVDEFVVDDDFGRRVAEFAGFEFLFCCFVHDIIITSLVLSRLADEASRQTDQSANSAFQSARA